MPELIKNRYNQTTPSSITSNGLCISTPFYLNITTDQGKQLLNAFRSIVHKQRVELGYDNTTKTVGQLSVTTNIKPPLTPAEEELGMNEESLRYALFSRQGTPERLVLKLCSITGVYITTREEIESVFSAWLDHLYPTNEQSKAKTVSPPRQTTKKRTTTKRPKSTVKSTTS